MTLKNKIRTKQNQKEFYEEYWKRREAEGCVHTKKEGWLPERVETTVDMIIKDFDFNKENRIYVLDIGCGDGIFGKLLKEKLKDKVFIIGCDISDIVLKEASIYYSNVFQVDIETDVLTKSINKQKFDYIVVLEVLEHLFKPANVLRQCYTFLKDEGFLIASFPNIVWYKYRLNMLRGRFPQNYLLYPGEHIQNFTLDSFYKLLQENGFSPIGIDGQFLFPQIFKPIKFLTCIFKKFPNLFGYQIVVKSKKEKY